MTPVKASQVRHKMAGVFTLSAERPANGGTLELTDTQRLETWNNLTVWTGEGQMGLILDSRRRKTVTISKLETKTNAAVQLIKRAANRRAGTREGSLMRLVQFFAISHLAYVAAYLN
ncbi:hypothetical protein HPB47_008434 [Ixodes persulcatus]|uniref:Uncharacterized protein n=1 Tax=Ixodes persulcatus TaxID=34615 RepID=A0AC60P4Q2_IXOPE|nr:hypothetical protein HPB47_008434 [Ixodes persulcatus]